MTVLWLIFWLLDGTPDVVFSGQWNNWAIALVICLALDIFGGGSRL